MATYEGFFVKQADSYYKSRPTYPASLFENLASLTQQHERAWDAGCGNGQAAISVAQHYKSVIATDVSEPQLSLAIQRPNITYCKMSSTPSPEELERVVGPEGSVDLVTVATALHWFDLDKFYPIVKHVLRKPGGVFAAWTYTALRISPEMDKELDRFYQNPTPYWTERSQVAVEGYKAISFPFEPVPGASEGRGVEGNPEELKMEKLMSFGDLMVLFKSSPTVQRALDDGVDLLNEETRQTLSKAWGSEEKRTVTFPICLLMGTVSAPTVR